MTAARTLEPRATPRYMDAVMPRIAILLLAAALAGPASAADDGRAHFENGDFAAAAAAWTPLAERGDRWAMAGLGHVAAIRGRHEEAARWYRAAAARGHVESQVLLASAYLEGRGVARDPELAYAWYHFAAGAGHDQAAAARDFAGRWIAPERQAELRAMVRRWRLDGVPDSP